MAIFVLPQPVGRPPYISGPTNRNIIFVEYEHIVTASEEGDFELWFPYVDGNPEPHHAKVHMATIGLSEDLRNPKQIYAFMQSPDELVRTVIPSHFPVLPEVGLYSLGCPFIAVHGSRGILALNSAPEGLEITASYQLELI